MTGSKSPTEKHKGPDPYSKLTHTQERNRKTGPIIIGATVAAVLVIGLIAFLATRGGGDDKVTTGSGAAAAANATQQTANVTVSGEDLPAYPSDATTPLVDPAKDPAVGSVIPKLVGQSFDGSPVTVDPTDGTPKVVMFVAHWCPHCQAEVPLIQQAIADGKLPKDVKIYTVSTAVSDQKPNYPPSNWLNKVGWQPQVLLDDAGGTAAQAYALPGFPYFVMANGQGKVVQRGSGEIPIADFEKAVDSLAATAGSGSTTTAASSN
jgi:cytochrome c biogenesis protein CcmG/thiol:disulfide interchange protein DsbE